MSFLESHRVDARKPVSMKLYASWEVEKTSSSCVPRLCTLRLTRLVVPRCLEQELQSIVIAVKMQGSKRVLRSNEVLLSADGTVDVELDLFFSLQYPHFLKRDCNKLQVLLQRRKKYRTILGYKSLVAGTIDMAGVLQHSEDQELALYSLKEVSYGGGGPPPTGKDSGSGPPVAAVVSLSTLTSQPVDHAEHSATTSKHSESDDDDLSTSAEDASDSEVEEGRVQASSKRLRKKERRMFGRTQQRNLKQRFVNLLKKFRAAEEVLDAEPSLVVPEPTRLELDALFDELEEFSDSAPEVDDSVSVRSTPKPSIRPFFVRRSDSKEAIEDTSPTLQDLVLASDDSSKKPDSDAPVETSDGDHSEHAGEISDQRVVRANTQQRTHSDRCPRSYERQSSWTEQNQKLPGINKIVCTKQLYLEGESGVLLPSKGLMEQLAALGPADDVAVVPNALFYYNPADPVAQALSCGVRQLLPALHVLPATHACDARAVLACLLQRIFKFTNQSSREPGLCQVAVCGTDAFLELLLHAYVQEAGLRVLDWSAYIRFYFIPTGSNGGCGSLLARQLAQHDSLYAALFCDSVWREVTEAVSSQQLPSDLLSEACSRVQRFLSCDSSPLRLSLGEAMITHKRLDGDDSSSRLFVPFISEVRVGVADQVPASWGGGSSGEAEDNTVRDSPPGSPRGRDKLQDTLERSTEELQLEYWVAARPDSESRRKDTQRSGVRLAVRALRVYWQTLNLADVGGQMEERRLCVVAVPREKKQKIIKFAKRVSKSEEPRTLVVDGISRMICFAKQGTFSVCVDGREFKAVKFFQVGPQWQTHVKHFPLAEFT